MKYIIAVSGGVDSVVLLDVMAERSRKDDLLVAHFEHGIRGEDSLADARFVKALSDSYGVRSIVEHGHLDAATSEADARDKRYDFLHRLAKQENAKLVTAHHQDDLIETIGLNVIRGTGWRGLTPMHDARILRPLISKRKSELYAYALKHGLEWVEDATNNSNAYTRNRIRRKIHGLSETGRQKLLRLNEVQQQLRSAIEHEGQKYMTLAGSRYFLTMVPSSVAVELLRTKLGARLTRPQLGRLLHAVKVAPLHSTYEAGNGVTVTFTSRDMVVIPPV